MLGRIAPASILNGEQPISRRAALLGLGGLAATSIAPSAAAQTERKSLNLDFNKAEDNLTAWVKLASSLEDGVETCGFLVASSTVISALRKL